MKTALTIILSLFAIVLVAVVATMLGGPSKPATTCTDTDAKLTAQGAVERILKDPEGADFTPWHEWTIADDPAYPGQLIVTGEVTAANSFGGRIKQRFTAAVRCDKGTWYYGQVKLMPR